MKVPILSSALALAFTLTTAHASFTKVNHGKHKDDVIDASAGGKTITLDAGANADLLIVGTSTELGNGSSFTVTYDGNPMTLASGNGVQSNVFYLDLTGTTYAGGDADLVVSWNYTAGGDLGIGWVSVDANLGPSGSLTTPLAVSSASSASVDLTTTTNTFNFVNFNANKGDNFSNLVDAPLTELYSDGSFGSNAGGAGYQTNVAAGTHTYSWSHAPASTLRRIDAVAFGATWPSDSSRPHGGNLDQLA